MIYLELGDVLVRDLTPLMIQRWMERPSRKTLDREPYAAATIHPTVGVLYGALREAWLFGLITSNPAEAIRRPGIETDAMTVWTEEEARLDLAIIAADPIYGTLYRSRSRPACGRASSAPPSDPASTGTASTGTAVGSRSPRR